MIITCNECDIRFNLDESLLKQTGSKVRCSKCKNIFLAYPSSLSEEPDKPGEVEIELEVANADEEIEWSEQYKVEEAGTEPQELNFFDIDKLLEIDEDLKVEKKSDEPEPESESELEPGDKTDSEINEEEEPESIEICVDMESDIFCPKEDKETETKIEESKQEDTDQDQISGGFAAETIEGEEESSKTFDMVAMPDAQEAEKDTLTEKDELSKVAVKRISTPILLLLLAAFLISGSYGIYVLLDRVKINIPFVSDLLTPKVQDAGNLKIYTSDIKNKFVENSKIGRLLVITGKAKNGYSDTRNSISIIGKLYITGKILSKTKTVCCGTVISELDLINMDIDSINNKLSNCFGENKSNVQVKAGLMVPFMIVFDDLPENLDEFTIEVVESFSL